MVLVIVLCTAGAGVGGSSLAVELLSRARVNGWERDGVAAAQAGQFDKAADLLARYVQRRPEAQPETLEWYIRSRERAELPDGRHIRDTITALELLLRRDPYSPARIEDRRHLLELYVRVGRWSEAVELADSILGPDRSGAPADVRTLDLKVQALLGMQRAGEALAAADRWVEVAPLDLKGHLTRFSLQSRLRFPPQQLVVQAEELRNSHPSDARFELLQGYAYALVGDRADDDLAARWLKTAAAHRGNSDEFTATLVEQFDKINMPDQAVVVLRTRLAEAGSRDLAHRLARRSWQQGRWKEVIDNLGDVDPADSQSDATLLAFKAIALANLNRKGAADACRAGLTARKTAAGHAWSLLLGRIIDAREIDDRTVVASCRQALIADPENAYLATYLGDSSSRLGEIDTAIASWTAALPHVEGWPVPR